MDENEVAAGATSAYDEIEYNVRCPRDGALRGRADTYEQARSYAEDRDRECGRCYKSHGPHVVVRRWVTLWAVAPAPTLTS